MSTVTLIVCYHTGNWSLEKFEIPEDDVPQFEVETMNNEKLVEWLPSSLKERPSFLESVFHMSVLGISSI